MRKQGRMLYEKYLGTVQAVLDTTLSIVRNRIGIPPLPVIDIPSPSIFNENFKVKIHTVTTYLNSISFNINFQILAYKDGTYYT